MTAMEFRFHRKETTASTNADAREGHPGDVFVADFQTAGRGRLDHEWHAARGENLTFSVVLDAADASPAEVATLPLVVGLAVARAVGSLLGKISEVAVKWPNDVLVGGRKICGILCERNGDAVIAGVGLNVNQTDFPAEIAGAALSRKSAHSTLVGGAADLPRSAAYLPRLIFLKVARFRYSRLTAIPRRWRGCAVACRTTARFLWAKRGCTPAKRTWLARQPRSLLRVTP